VSTDTAANGRWVRSALRNAADGSIATTSTWASHAAGRAASHAPTPADPRPSTMPSTCPVVTSTIVDILPREREVPPGSYRAHAPVCVR